MRRQPSSGRADVPPGIVVVANRGPNDFIWRNGRWVTRTASGGLVSMLTPLARRPGMAWFCCVSEPPDAEQARHGLFTTASDQTDPRLHVIPVPLPADVYHAYYGQVSNEVLWMLQHYLIGPGGYQHVDERRHRAWTEGYMVANRRLADSIAATCSEPTAFLVQDYHLYPLPALLRSTFPTTPILHFTHIPFPEPSILELLPCTWRETILLGLLGADVVGVQTPRDAQAFLDGCSHVLRVDVDPVERAVRSPDGRWVAVRAYPASVDPPALARTMRSATVAEHRRRLAPLEGNLTVVRVDRLDPSKNQIVGFLAFERLLEERPDLRPRLRFLAFLVPSRTDLGVYRDYRDSVYAAIGRINTRFAADCGGDCIQVSYTNNRDQALAAMESCDALLVNSLKDGMNLVAKEWAVVSRRPGVLVVSETAGVAAEAVGSALLASPLDVEATARALAVALDMPAAQRAERLARLRGHVERWTAHDWLFAQLRDLGVADAPGAGRSPGAGVNGEERSRVASRPDRSLAERR